MSDGTGREGVAGEAAGLRREFGLTQGDLAFLLGLPAPYAGGAVRVSRWETGARPPPRLLALALEAVRDRLGRRLGYWHARIGEARREAGLDRRGEA